MPSREDLGGNTIFGSQEASPRGGVSDVVGVTGGSFPARTCPVTVAGRRNEGATNHPAAICWAKVLRSMSSLGKTLLSYRSGILGLA